ncbi:M48 family metallopeptidase [Rivularia sp. UHCC 0363]|uniref:M48 family metallopeptidase n=1 Tax=Rivularia sp. UHCC 0363 TaxID=3110244 RepID=UPI002B208C75|nr:M48 family metallopeptidase [Rivularia sp. UHCC 0363]MEA5597816.1 M48 family metallopeptidase [Rivularia sp. UHCC 0363]
MPLFDCKQEVQLNKAIIRHIIYVLLKTSLNLMMEKKNFYLNFRSLRKRFFYPLVSVVTAITLCLVTPTLAQGRSIWDVLFQGVQIIQLSNISDKQEIQLGRQINQQLLSSDVKLYSNSQVNNYIKRIGKRLEAQNTRKNIPYTFQVVRDDNINAFATTGGYVYINTGLIKAADNEAELASVIAHEMGHIEGDHVIEQMRKSAIANGLATAAGVEQNKLVQLGVELAYRRPNSRGAEKEADQLGLKLLTDSGYAPQAMVSFMKKLESKSRGSVPTFLSTHPSPSNRVQYLQSWVNAERNKGNDGLSQAAYRQSVQPLL